MAIKQIYGPNQFAGIPVAGTGKSQPTSDGTTPLMQVVALAPSTDDSTSIAPDANAALADSKVFKASGGNVFSLNLDAPSISGYFLLVDGIAKPPDGAVTPKRFWRANGGQTLDLSFNPPLRCNTGITVVFSSNTTTPYTLAASATAAISGEFI